MLTSFSWIQSSRRALKTNMAYSNVVASLLVALISSLISCVQINAAVINLHNQYIRNRQDVLRLLSMNSCHHKVKKRANHHRRRFWTRPGRTSAWWDNFLNIWHNDQRFPDDAFCNLLCFVFFRDRQQEFNFIISPFICISILFVPFFSRFRHFFD